MSIRPFKPEDEPELVLLWQTAFGDSAVFINNFLHNIVRPGRGMVFDKDGRICSAAYLVDGITVRGERIPYIYATATLPEYRGRGFAAAVLRACAEFVKPTRCIVSPANENLLKWYEKRNFIPSYSLYEAKLPTEYSDFKLKELNAKEYTTIRRELLCGTVYADFDTKLLEWWQEYWNGSFYSFDGGCVSIYPQNDGFMIPELLAHKNGRAVLGRLCGGLPVIVRTPPMKGFETFGERKFLLSAYPADADVFWSFIFD